MKLRTTAAMLCVAMLAGCATTDPYTGEQKTSNTTKGAVGGALAGAVIGMATSSKSDRGKGALIGAVAGGAIGGGVGNYMDKQETELRNKLAGTGVSVKRTGDNIQLVLPNTLTFASGQSDLQYAAVNTLSGVAMVLAEYDKTRLEISGHTDSTGGADLNQRLSIARAESVAAELTRQGVASYRVSTAGYGPLRPVATNDTTAGRAANRRVEILLIPTP
ncbi:OmpA family protein [Ferrimonas lipolytica]|uniref:OmpA family protein n=1 Tax=Ferrimonas lipolytica TaxID=2724191 RepID=A0A6H1UID6_9GAMM|nr:OmpA family protein [Ferrimonas lipolytica]QIZ78588.1 OmpA family protein [Ferrimonas lipolytica]